MAEAPFPPPAMPWRPAWLVDDGRLPASSDDRIGHIPFACWLIEALRPLRLLLVGRAEDPVHRAIGEAAGRLDGAAVHTMAATDHPLAEAVADGTIDLVSLAPDASAAEWRAAICRILAAKGIVLLPGSDAAAIGDGGAAAPGGGAVMRFVHGGGLSVVAGTGGLHPAAEALFAAGAAAAEAMQTRFAALGEGLVAMRRAARLEARLSETEQRLRQAVDDADAARRLLTEAHAAAVDADLTRRKVKRLNKAITRSWTWHIAKPAWLLEQRLRAAGGGAVPDAPDYGIARRDYQRWIDRYDSLGKDGAERIRAFVSALPAPPAISIVMPVYNTDPAHLAAAIASVEAQLYPDWQLCVADDASPDPAIRPLLAAAAARDARIRVVHRDDNGGIVAASNSALALASGDLVTFLDHDDTLAPHALAAVAATLARHPDAELVYSDEDHLDDQGRRYNPHFKSGWNPDLLLSQNYVCHLAVYRTARVRALGGLRAGFDGSQDWDLALRVSGAVDAARIHHIPLVLYHWRTHPGRQQFSQTRLAEAEASGRRAVAEHLARIGGPARVTATLEGYNHVRRPLPDPAPLVSLIIPTRDRVDLLATCIAGVLERTRYPRFEIIIADNDSAEAATRDYFEAVTADPRIRVLACPGPFNYSAINNAAAATATGDILCLLNNDIEVLGADWLAEMVGHAIRPEVGAVGARLLYPDGRVQHGGCIVGIKGQVAHAHVLLARGDRGYFGRAKLTQDLSAVTGACLVTRRACFEAVGGLDADNLAVAYNDIDYCLKLRERGLLVVYAAQAELLHHESLSRGYDHVADEKRQRQQREAAWMQQRWGERLAADPYYNPNLSLDEPFQVAWPPRTVPPWRAGG